MAHIYQLNATGSWVATPLGAGRFTLAGGAAALHPSALRDSWVLVVAPRTGVSVNGQPLALGIRVLRDRDAVRLCDGSTFYFSTERLAEIHTFTGAKPISCPRCRLPIEPSMQVVVCPSCGATSHQSESLGCWLYGPTCPLCNHPTLYKGYRWTPEEL